MNKLILLILPLFIVINNKINAQAYQNLEITLSIDSVAHSVFLNNTFDLNYKINPNTELFEMVKSLPFEVKFPNRSWMRYTLELSNSEPSESLVYEHTKDTFLPLLPYYFEDSTLLLDFNGGTVWVRYFSIITDTLGNWTEFFSDSIALNLPPPTTDDIKAFRYIKEKNISKDDIESFTLLYNEYIIIDDLTIISSFSNSTLADIAKYIITVENEAQLNIQYKGNIPDDMKQPLIESYQSLVFSKDNIVSFFSKSRIYYLSK
jgi:hypothetical protein